MGSIGSVGETSVGRVTSEGCVAVARRALAPGAGVDPDARGAGRGAAAGGRRGLARECLRRARERTATAIGLHTAARMPSATRLYERLGFRRAPEFDTEIGEMFTGRPLPPGQSWQAQAYRLDLEGV
jgi:GNAT superfamily N-acetyltransferase